MLNSVEQVAIGVRVPKELGERLAAMASREGNGVSAVVRRLLTEGLAREAGGSAAVEVVDRVTGEVTARRPSKAELEALVERVAPGAVVAGPRVVAMAKPDLRGMSPRQAAIERERLRQYAIDHPEEVPQ
jgi:predicted DNA-binding protein